MIRALALCLLAAPALAQGTCPTAADLLRGVAVTYDDGRREVFRAGAPGVVVLDRTDPGGAPLRFELARGIYLLSFESSAAPHARVDYGHGAAPAALPAPAPGVRLHLDVAVRPPGGAPSLRRGYAMGREGGLLVGPCAYRAVPVVVAHLAPGADDPLDATQTLAYLPDLGLALETGLAVNEPDIPPESRSPIAIAAAP